VGLCLTAAIAIGAVTSAAASAEPEFLTKAVVPEGSSIPLAGSVAPSTWETKNGTKLTCTTGTITGEVTGPKSLANTVLLLKGCEGSGCLFESAGKPEGTVESDVLAGTLGGVTATLPGIKLFSQSEGKGGMVIEAAACGGAIPLKWKGEVTGSVSGSAGEGPETGKLLSSFKLTLTQSKGVQKYQGFSEGLESGLLGQLESSFGGKAYEPNGWAVALTLKTVPSTWELGITR
jgi:hypothetical protein